MQVDGDILVIGGPTASGKSALAMRVAEAKNGVVINADSQQLYKELPILSACPSEADYAKVPHALYGVMSVMEPSSVGKWLALVKDAVETAQAQGRLPIIVGGTGLYLGCLLHGIAPMPEVDMEVRERGRSMLEEMGNEAFHAMLSELDPEAGARLKVGDSQRMVRAWEVMEQSGRSIVEWQEAPREKVMPEADFATWVLLPAREVIYARCNDRFADMVHDGVVDEVCQLEAILAEHQVDDRRIDSGLKASGLPEIRRYIRGKINHDEMVELAQISTRHYAKRQMTWLRHQLRADQLFDVVGEDVDF